MRSACGPANFEAEAEKRIAGSRSLPHTTETNFVSSFRIFPKNIRRKNPGNFEISSSSYLPIYLLWNFPAGRRGMGEEKRGDGEKRHSGIQMQLFSNSKTKKADSPKTKSEKKSDRFLSFPIGHRNRGKGGKRRARTVTGTDPHFWEERRRRRRRRRRVI